MTEKVKYPEWAIKHKKPGTELRHIRGHYYLYAVSSRWDKTKKRAKKITGKIVGKITEKDGFIPSKTRILPSTSDYSSVSIKEYGASSLLNTLFKESVEQLSDYFPKEASEIVSATFFRLLHQSPLKNMGHYLSQSFISEYYNSCYAAVEKAA